LTGQTHPLWPPPDGHSTALCRAARMTGLRKRDDESFDAYEARATAALLGGAGHFAEAEKYDAILIDEGHDFEPEWFRCATNLLKGGPEGDLLIAVDWGPEPLRPGPGVHLEVGRRGGSRPLAAALAELPEHQADPGVRLAGGPVGHQGRRGVRDARQGLADQGVRQGPVPVYRGCTSMAEEHALIAWLVGEFRATGLASRDIAVLYPRREGDRVDALCRRLRESGEVCWVSNEGDRSAGSGRWHAPGSAC